MGGINREIILDTRHIAKHLPGTAQVQRLLRRGRSAHVFNDLGTMERVAQIIIERGELTGEIRGYERYGLFFVESIGYQKYGTGKPCPLGRGCAECLNFLASQIYATHCYEQGAKM